MSFAARNAAIGASGIFHRSGLPMRVSILPVRAAVLFVFAAGLLLSAAALAAPADTSCTMNGPVDRIVVEKSQRRLTLLRGQEEVAVYRVALGRNPIGPKVMRGDDRTPEGLYFVDYKVRISVYHRSLHLTYPNLDDLTRADSLGVSPGSQIMIHGMSGRQLWMGDVQYLFDWTNGCIALTNSEIEEIWDLVLPWTPVEIRP
jgi:murein L,D-transpeptidase YafK